MPTWHWVVTSSRQFTVMATAPDAGPLTVSLHPDDFMTLVGTAGDTEFEYDGRRITLRPDSSLSPGDATAETGMATVDATIAAAVARAREALRLAEVTS